jgi:hypothetical protein
MPKSKPVRVRVVEAWAVVDTVLARAHGAYMIFNPALSMFSLAIFTHPDFAQRYADGFKGKLKLKVVPITVTYQLPVKKKVNEKI